MDQINESKRRTERSTQNQGKNRTEIVASRITKLGRHFARSQSRSKLKRKSHEELAKTRISSPHHFTKNIMFDKRELNGPLKPDDTHSMILWVPR